MWTFIQDHFDKLLLSGFVVLGVLVVVVLTMYGRAPETVSWLRELTSGFAGGLLGLITGIAVGRKMEKTETKEKE